VLSEAVLVIVNFVLQDPLSEAQLFFHSHRLFSLITLTFYLQFCNKNA
jgi:hypothetical protein